MATIVSVNWQRMMVQMSDGTEHELFQHEFCYLAPSRTTWDSREGDVRPLDFAMLLHNARTGRGCVPSMDELLAGITPKNMKTGDEAKAEKLLEAVRQDAHPDKPSRLRCHFLNHDRHVAEQRIEAWDWKERRLVRCFLILSGGRYHFADESIYAKLTNAPDDLGLAEQYWQGFLPANDEQRARLEVLADSALFFPDWREFPELNIDDMAAHQRSRNA